MAFLPHKVVAELPGTLQADSVYFVRAGAGVDMYVTNSTPTIVAYRVNGPDNGVYYVAYGTDINTARPNVPGMVIWYGEGQPVNMIEGDFVIRVDEAVT